MEPAVLMPDLSRPRRGFRHTLDSALNVLFGLGVSAGRITVNMAGPGWPVDVVAAQDPAPGTPLTADRAVTLSVAAGGLFSALPSGMWDKGGERDFGSAELVSLFDDPLQKMAHWVRDGARLFDIGRDKPEACIRWLSLFGVAAEDWPAELHYDLAVLLPSLHRLAGRESGMRLVFSTLLKLPLLEIRRQLNAVRLAREQQSRLGAQNSRLGLETIAGDRRDDLSGWRLVLGPVSLATYRQYREPYYQKLLRAALDMAVPCYQAAEIGWSVLDARQAPRLGCPEQNGVLGVNTHLGQALETKGTR